MGSSEINVLLESLKRIHNNLDAHGEKIDVIKEILIENSDQIEFIEKRVTKLERESAKKIDWKFISIMIGMLGIIITAFTSLYSIKVT